MSNEEEIINNHEEDDHEEDNHEEDHHEEDQDELDSEFTDDEVLSETSENAQDKDKEEGDVNEENYGCAHYKCRCAYIAPCCNKKYVCRICHDESEPHEMNRFDVKEIVCLMCDERQPVQKNCQKCNVEFGKYFCPICRLFDDRDKRQFHCDKCGICRVGGRENFFHCDKCDMCLGIGLKDQHKCVEKVSHADCPICLENLHTSREELHVFNCGHICHRKCFQGLLSSGNFTCPLCCHSAVDMSRAWAALDQEIEATPMPEEYRDKKEWILCKDCHKECETKFHIFGLKCTNCGSYNTCGTTNPNQEPPVVPMESANSEFHAISPPSANPVPPFASVGLANLRPRLISLGLANPGPANEGADSNPEPSGTPVDPSEEQ